MSGFQVQQDHSLNNESGFYSPENGPSKRNQQAVLDWGVGILVLSVAAYLLPLLVRLRTWSADTEVSEKKVPTPNWSSSPATRSLGEFPVVSRPSNGRRYLPHSRSFLEPDTHSLPSADNHSLVPWCTTA